MPSRHHITVSFTTLAVLFCAACSGSAEPAQQAEPGLKSQAGALGDTYVTVTPTEVAARTFALVVVGKVDQEARAALCAKSTIAVDTKPGSIASCSWRVDDAQNDVGDITFAVVSTPSSKVTTTLQSDAGSLELRWLPSGFFGGNG